MKNYHADWYEVRVDGEILVVKTPLLWRCFFGLMSFPFAAIALGSMYLLYGTPVQNNDGSQSVLLCLIIMFGLLALTPLYLALPYQLQLDFKRQAYETQQGLLGSRYGSFTEIKNVFVQRITMGNKYWYRVSFAWQGKPVRRVPILTETPDLAGAEAFARTLASRLEVPFTGMTGKYLEK